MTNTMGIKSSAASKTIIPVLGVGLAMLFICLQAYSQGSSGRILGTVTDQSGGVIAGATVTVTDIQRGVSRALTTDDAGEYSAPQLLPGTYKVRAESKGFSATERTDLLLETGKEIRVDFSLSPGQQTQTITVTEQLPVVETTNATLGGTLSNQTINDLPLNGRNYQNLLSLRPGVLAEPGGGSWTQSTNGVRPEDNVFLVNGMLNVGAFSALSILNAPALAGDAASILPIDAIQEFNIEENPRAEYGWKPGAVINVGIKSGTNSLHGTAYAFGRQTSFDARNFFNQVSEGCTAPCPKTEVALEQYGGTVGGPIKKDKIFFFAGYEGQRYTVGSPFLANTPVTTSLAGTANQANGAAWSVPDAEAALNAKCLAAATPKPTYCTGNVANLSPLSLHLLQNFFPANNTSSIIVPANFPSNFASDNWVAKFDLHLNEKNNLSAMYFIANSVVNDEDSAYLQPIFLTVQTQRPQVGNVDWTFTPNSRVVNEAEFGVQYLFKPSFVGDHTVNPTTYGLNTGVTNPLFFGMPQIMITGGGTSFTTLGGATWPKIQGPETDFVAQDHVSYLTGKHSFKFGGEIIDDNFTGGALNGVRGSIRFGNNTAFSGATSLEDYLLGLPNQGKQLVGNAERRAYSTDYAAFLQDDWRIRPRVILNLGVRYEVDGVIKEVNDQFGNFLPSEGLVQVGHGITTPYNGDHNNFAPRIGLAWDMFGNGKTVLRAGGSIIYEQLSYNVFLAYSNTLGLGTVPTGAVINNVTGQTAGGNIQVASFTFPASSVNWNGSSVGGATIFPTGVVNCSPLVNPVTHTAGSPCQTVAVDPNLRTPYVSTWTMEIQHAFTNNLSLEVGYVGDHGTKLIGFSDINQPVPSLVLPPTGMNITAAPTCTTCEQNARPYNTAFPYLSSIFQLSNQDLSNYNSLQATLTQRTSHGLSFTAGYTYSHALDDASGNFGGGLPQDSTRPGLDYGASNFDIRHRFTFSTTYALPGRTGFGEMLEGWKVNSIVTVQTPQPWSGSDSGDFSLTGNGARWDFFGNPADFRSGPDLTQIPHLIGAAAVADPTCSADAAIVGLPAAQLAAPGSGCYIKNGSVLIQPPIGQFGTAGRNIFRGSGFKNWDVSVTKEFSFRETLKAQFRAEIFNVLNHPNFATPGVNGAGSNNPSGSNFGVALATPDTAASNPVLGSGGSRAMQLGLKLIF